MQEEKSKGSPEVCINCSAPLLGKFCHQCGEKKIVPATDFSIKKFLEQTVDGLTHFDSKFLRSFGNLMWRPGRLTAEFVAGRHKRYMKPVQVFVVAALIFFIFQPRTTSFHVYWVDMLEGYKSGHITPDNLVRYNLERRIARILLAKDSTVRTNNARKEELVRQTVDKAVSIAAPRSKAFMFMLIPFWGITLWVFFGRQQKFLAPHLVAALHILSFFLIADMLYLQVMHFFFTYLSDWQIMPILLLLLAYIVIAIRRVYAQSWFHAVWKGILTFCIFLVFVLLYRNFITISAYESIQL